MSEELRRLRDEEDVARELRDALEVGRELPADAEVDALEAAVMAAIGGGAGGGGPSGGGPSGGGALTASKVAGWGPYALAGTLVAASIGAAVWSTVRQPTREEEAREEWRAMVEQARLAALGLIDVSFVDGGSPSDDAGVGGAEVEVEAGAEAETETEAETAAETAAETETEAEAEAATEAGAAGSGRRATGVAPEAGGAAEEPDVELRNELALLREARRVLASDPARALAATDEMREVIAPTWAEERERIAIEALHRLDRDPEARRRLEAFVRTYPSSAYRARLEEILASSP